MTTELGMGAGMQGGGGGGPRPRLPTYQRSDMVTVLAGGYRKEKRNGSCQRSEWRD